MAELSIDPDYLRRLIVKVRSFMAKEETDIPDEGSNPDRRRGPARRAAGRGGRPEPRGGGRGDPGADPPPAGRARGADVARPRRRRARGVERASSPAPSSAARCRPRIICSTTRCSPSTGSTAWSALALAASSPTPTSWQGREGAAPSLPLSTTCRRRLSPRTADKAARSGSDLSLACRRRPWRAQALPCRRQDAAAFPTAHGSGRPRGRGRFHRRLGRGRGAGCGAAGLPALGRGHRFRRCYAAAAGFFAAAFFFRRGCVLPRLSSLPLRVSRRLLCRRPLRGGLAGRCLTGGSLPRRGLLLGAGLLRSRPCGARAGGWSFLRLVFLLVVRFFPLVFVAMVLLRF